MNKILYIVLLLIGCVSCEEYTQKWDEATEKRRRERIERQTVADSTYFDFMHNVEFDGHLYVVYDRSGSYGIGAGIVHSPNCKCNIEE